MIINHYIENLKCGIIYNRKYNLHDMFVQNLDYTRYYNKNKHKNKNKNKIKNTVPNTSYFLGKNNVTPWPFEEVQKGGQNVSATVNAKV